MTTLLSSISSALTTSSAGTWLKVRQCCADLEGDGICQALARRLWGRTRWRHLYLQPRTRAHQRSPAMMRQLDLFAAPLDPPHRADVPINPLHGSSVQLSDTCQCGSCDVVIGEGKGAHRAAFFCSQCDRHRGWMANEVHSFVVQVIQKFGKSTTPIRIRRKRSKEEQT